MSEEFTPEQPSTPAQVAEIFGQIGELTALQGKNHGDRYTFPQVVVAVPDSVSEHFPTIELNSEGAARTVSAMQKLDRVSGQPNREGVVASVSFDQTERRDAGLSYGTHVNYQVISDDGETYRLERHVAGTEQGKHRTREDMGQLATREAMEEQLAERTALLARTLQARKDEANLGLSTVSSLEAHQISETLSALISGK